MSLLSRRLVYYIPFFPRQGIPMILSKDDEKLANFSTVGITNPNHLKKIDKLKADLKSFDGLPFIPETEIKDFICGAAVRASILTVLTNTPIIFAVPLITAFSNESYCRSREIGETRDCLRRFMVEFPDNTTK